MNLLKSNKPFFLFYAIFLILGLLILYNFSKTEQMIWINVHHSPFLDVFFQAMTFIGDGGFFVGLTILLFFIDKNLGKVALAIFLLTTLLSQFFKHLVFPNHLRPIAFFEGRNIDWHLIQGLEIHRFNSMPSGHTASAFAMFGLLAIFFRNKNVGYLFCVLAALVGYSRAYLFQHFPEDILAGSVLGVFCAWVGCLKQYDCRYDF